MHNVRGCAEILPPAQLTWIGKSDFGVIFFLLPQMRLLAFKRAFGSVSFNSENGCKFSGLKSHFEIVFMTRGISENAQHIRSATECVNRLTTSNYFDGYFTRLVKNLKRGLVHVFNSSQTSVYKQILMFAAWWIRRLFVRNGSSQQNFQRRRGEDCFSSVDSIWQWKIIEISEKEGTGN